MIFNLLRLRKSYPGVLLLLVFITMMLYLNKSCHAWVMRPPVVKSTHMASFRRMSVKAMAGADNTGDNIGFIGLGYMGNGMVRRLLEAEHNKKKKIVVWNRSLDKAKLLAKEYEGGRVVIADSPKDVIESASITFSMLSTPQAAHEVFNAPKGVLEGIGKGKALVDCATLEVKDMTTFAQAVHGKGGKFLEAPVSGSKVPAEQGQLIFLTGGDRSLYDEILPHLEAMGKAHYYLGETGKGTEMKLIVNMVMACMMASFSEGLTLAEKADLSPQDLISILGLGAMANPMFNLKGPKILANDHTPNFPLKHAQKDLAFSINLAETLGVSVKTALASNEFYQDSLKQGEGDLDFSAVSKAVLRSVRQK